MLRKSENYIHFAELTGKLKVDQAKYTFVYHAANTKKRPNKVNDELWVNDAMGNTR